MHRLEVNETTGRRIRCRTRQLTAEQSERQTGGPHAVANPLASLMLTGEGLVQVRGLRSPDSVAKSWISSGFKVRVRLAFSPIWISTKVRLVMVSAFMAILPKRASRVNFMIRMAIRNSS